MVKVALTIGQCSLRSLKRNSHHRSLAVSKFHTRKNSMIQPLSTSQSNQQLIGQIDPQDELVIDLANSYRELGLRILPLCRTTGHSWLAKEKQLSFQCSPENTPLLFKGMDVGLMLQPSGIVGIDVDCSEVVPFLNGLLPPTCTVGRGGKPTSWMFYRLHGTVPKNMSFHDFDLDGKASGEIGGIKVNAIVPLPPSRHRKTQASLIWTNGGEPTAMESKHFLGVARKCFAMALIARHWPGPGNRHEPTLALAGAFAKAGWSLDEAKEAVRLLVSATGDHKLDDRLTEVKSTYDHFQKGEGTTGLPRLGNLLQLSLNGQIKLEQSLRDWLGFNDTEKTEDGNGTDESLNFPLSKYALSLGELMAKELPEQQFIVHPWLPTQALIMVYAARGVGKTWVALEMAISIAIGRDFLAWPVPKPRRVLFIDGEMPLASLQFRLRSLLGNTPLPEGLTLISSTLLWQDSAPLNISQPKQQLRVDTLLNEMKSKGKEPDLIILDNLSSLVTGIDENSNSDLDQFLQWLVKLRSQGYAVMAVHHAGKNGDQRGGSRREDLLDTVVKLEKRESLNLAVAEGACFDIKFTKLRGENPKPISLVAALTANEKGHLFWKHEEDQKLPAYMKVMQGIHDYKPTTQTALADQLKCTRQHVSEQVKICVEKGLVSKQDLSLTPKGVGVMAPVIQAAKKYANDL